MHFRVHSMNVKIWNIKYRIFKRRKQNGMPIALNVTDDYRRIMIILEN